MTLQKIKEILNAKVVLGEEFLDREIQKACGSDLMSDVLLFIKTDALLLTGLTNSQVVRTAEMADVNSICFVRGKNPPEETIQLAKEKSIALLSTACTMFESCGRLYDAGLYGCDFE